MKTFSIELRRAEDVVNLVKIASGYDYDIELKSGDMRVDAKSIMGVMAMTEPMSERSFLELVVHAAQCDDLLGELEEYLCT